MIKQKNKDRNASARKLSTAEIEKIKSWFIAGYSKTRIAKLLGVRKATIVEHAEELELHLANANANVAISLFKKALQGDTSAEMFWLKCRMGWQEKPKDKQQVGTFTIYQGTDSDAEKWALERKK